MENYTTLANGVIKQVNINKVTYDYTYANKYNAYGEKGNYLSYLRLGVLLGVVQKTPKSLVDVGYGNGDFLKACRTLIPDLYGCDISKYPLPDGTKHIDFHDISGVDVVTFFDSLEHFDDIYAIKMIKTEYIFISVPWCHNLSDTWFLNWYHRRENEHLFHFNDKALVKFFDECGYDCMYMGCFEDAVRKNATLEGLPNILSAVFKKRA